MTTETEDSEIGEIEAAESLIITNDPISQHAGGHSGQDVGLSR